LEIETSRFGKIDVNEDKVLLFPWGLLGFSWAKRFVMIPHGGNSPFIWLQNLEDGNLAFVLIQPKIVMAEYRVEIEKQTMDELKAKNPSVLEVLCIVTIPKDKPEKMTVNLLGPIVVNPEERLAKQIVITTGEYSHQHPVLQGKA